MKNVDYTVEEIIKDEYFHKWLIEPDSACDEFWNKWMGNDPAKIKVIEEAKSILLSLSFHEEELSPNEKNKIWNSVYDIVGKPQIKMSHIWYKLAVAVSILIFGVFTFLSLKYIDDQNDNNNNEIVYIEKFIPKGQKSIIRLEDGTVVKLNSGSKIRYPKNFQKDSREVHLEGEAFFEVVKDPLRPFSVKSGEIETTVLGTSFNVKAYPDLEYINVAVVSGKVLVKNNSYLKAKAPKSQIVKHLTPNKMVTYDRKKRLFIKSDFIVEELLSWKDNTIYFKDTDFEGIRHVLERWYGVEFKMEKQIKIDKDFSGRFENKSLSAVMEGISFSLGFQYEIVGSVVTIK
ncbi:FecR domain-containing protein [Reichenbachiella sp. MALMAid0571]|uniref:FecR family protein n=1 Tax=Reichenbachiella sp. MALMAid0571 TaxID=3143939 RepID=UPI0032DEEBAC